MGPTRVLKPACTERLQVYVPGRMDQPDGPADDAPGAAEADAQARERRAYERGVADGERRAQEQMLAPLERQNALLAALVQELRAHREAWARELEDLAAGLALEIAAKVLRERNGALQAAVTAQARELVARLRNAGPLTIRVHPADVAAFEAIRAALTEASGGERVEIQGDARVSPGGCLIETPASIADARLEAQLMRFGDALRRREAGDA